MRQDGVEREIFISAGIEQIWFLVSRPRFWVGDALHFDVEVRKGDTMLIDTDTDWQFPVRVDPLDPPHYAAYRWASAVPGADLSGWDMQLERLCRVAEGVPA